MIVFLTVLVIVLLLLTILACGMVLRLFSLIMSLLAINTTLLHEQKGERLVCHDKRLNKIIEEAQDLFYTVPITKEEKK
jgi:hypothetical protein